MFVRFHFLVIHFNLILFSYIAPLSYGCNRHDKVALSSISLNFSLSLSNTLNWSSHVDCCLWQGITCNLNGRVTHLWLPSRKIKGIISPSFHKLVHLSHLNLSHNDLYGPLPDKFFSYLYNLVIVDLSFNRFYHKLSSSSPLPQSIHMVDLSNNDFFDKVQPLFLEFASNLIYFNVSSNSLEGSIPLPTCNYSWCLVKILDFSSNKFTGQIPPALGQFSKLEIFRAGFNMLSGLLPSHIYNLTSLTEISLPWNFLSGSIGEGLGHLSNLTILEIYGNNFTGSIPRNIGKLSNLKNLLLQNNNLTGSLPKSLTNCTKLVTINLCVNNLEGDLSILDFSKLEKLQVLDLGNNKFSNSESIYSCKSLTAIRLSNNPIGGQISSSILALESLSFFGLSSVGLTNISGAINILSRCKSLRFLTLSNNFYGEALPYGFNTIISHGFRYLQVFGLRNCLLMGQIPYWLSKLRSLKVLDLSANQLTGEIPLWLGKMPNLFNIDFSYNLFSGEIPREIATLASLSTNEIEPSSNMELPLFVSSANIYYTLIYLAPAINLRNNSFSGSIPDEIGQMKGLYILDLGSNDLSGSIPDRLSNLVNLEILDLSNNRLSGEIPRSLNLLRMLTSFSIANNNLQGPIPPCQFYIFPLSSYIGNPKLCGYPFQKLCEEADADDDKEGSDEEIEDENFWIYITAIIGFVLGFCMVCIPVACNKTRRNAYFEFLNDANDKIYVIIVVYIPRLWR